MLLEILTSLNFWLILITAVCCYIVKQFIDVKTGKTLPGPWGLPFVGYYYFLSDYIQEDFRKLSKIYGPVFQIRLGSRVMEDISQSHRVIQHIAKFQTGIDCFERSQSFDKYFRGNSWETNWYFHCAFTSPAPADTSEPIMLCCATITSCLAFGRDPNPDDPLLKRTFEYFSSVAVKFQNLGPVDFMPALEVLKRGIVKALFKDVQDFATYIAEQFGKHTFDGTVGTIADGLIKAKEEADDNELASVGLTKDEILRAAIDIFDGSFFPAAENTAWIQLILATHPEVQRKVHEEIDAVIGNDRLPSIADQANMPYTTACILEELRFVSNVPLALNHMAMDNFEFQGYQIPKGTIIIANTYAVNNDTRHFANPSQFNPENLLVEGKISSEKSANTMPFSSGLRRCPGENVAKQVLFILNTCIMQKFSVRLDPETQGNPLIPRPGVTLAPGVHKLIYNSRDLL